MLRDIKKHSSMPLAPLVGARTLFQKRRLEIRGDGWAPEAPEVYPQVTPWGVAFLIFLFGASMQGIGKLPWWEDETPAILRASISAAKTKIKSNKPFLTTFAKHSAVVCVYLSNKLECTLPTGVSQQETYLLLESAFDATPSYAELLEPPPKRWSADGSPNSASARVQLQQHMKALRFLCYDCKPGEQPLTVEMVKTAHKLLMSGATTSDGTVLTAGEYRSSAAHSGTGYIYPSPTVIGCKVPEILDAFNNRTEGTDIVVAAAKLMYDMVTLHPFQDGNGRLCRLLVSYALMAAGEPFPVPLHDGHHKCRQHYNHVLVHADHHLYTGKLAAFILDCLHFKWHNALTLLELEVACKVTTYDIIAEGASGLRSHDHRRRRLWPS